MMKSSTPSGTLLPYLLPKSAKSLIMLLAFAVVTLSTLLPATSFAAAQPVITSFAPASGPAGTLVTINGSGLSNAATFVVGSKLALIISTSDTKVVGMIMPSNVTGSVKVTLPGGVVAVAPGNFTITETPYPTQPQGGKLVDTSYTHPQPVYNGDVKVKQGVAVAVSADGNTAIVGTGMAFSTVGNAGAIFYTRKNGAWKLDGPMLSSDYYDVSTVAISADGNTAVSGVRYAQYGIARIYGRVNGAWAITGSTPGSNVTISADGNTIITGSQDGHTAHLLIRRGNNWAEIQFPDAGVANSPGAFPGNASREPSSVAISADSRTAIVSYESFTPRKSNYTLHGQTNIYVRNLATDTVWVLKQTLPIIGHIAVNADGRVFLLNHTKIYTRASIGVKFEASTTVQGAGQASMSADGKTIVYAENGPVAYTLTGTIYTAKPISGPKYSGRFYTSIGLSADGTTALLGNPGDTTTVLNYGPINEPTDNTSQLPLGAVYAFSSKASIGAYSPASGPVGTLVTANFTNISAPTSVKIGGKDALIISKTDNTVTAMVMPGAVTGPVMLGTLSAGDNFTVTATPFPNIQNGPKMADTNKYASAQLYPYYHGSTPPRPINSSDRLSYSLEQGTAIAISADGKTAVAASGKGTYSTLYFSGQNVIFYSKVNGSWKQSRFLTTAYTSQSHPVKAVINADGTFALVLFMDSPGSDFGFVYGYHKNTNGDWVPEAEQGIPGLFGPTTSLAMSADGNTAVTGYQRCYKGGCSSNVTICRRINGVWVGQPDPNGPIGTPNQTDPNYYIANAGPIVNISADGKTIAASVKQGSIQKGTNIYTNNGIKWVLQQNLASAIGNLTLSADGDVLLCGNRLYSRAANRWSYKQTLQQTGDASISADANTLLYNGSAGPVVYTRGSSTASWVKQATSFATGTPAFSVALSADGASGFAGNPQDTTVFPNQIHYKDGSVFNGNGWETSIDSTEKRPIGAVYGLGSGTPIVTPTVVITPITFFKTERPDSIQIRFTNGGGAARAVFIKQGSTGFPTTVDGVTYKANPVFGQGASGGAGWYCIYNGNRVPGEIPYVSGLAPGTPYIVAVVEYNGKYGAEKYATSGTTGKVITDNLNIQAKDVAFSNTTGTTTTLSWTSGSGAGRMVFMQATQYDGGAGPLNTYYSPNARYGSGNQVNGWYCVYNGTGNTVNITGLTAGKRYRAIVYEYNGSIQAPEIISVYEVQAANVVTPIVAPTGYATNLAFSNTAATSTTLSWVSSNGAARAVFVRLGTTGAINVTQGVTYTANNTFASGTQAGTNGWYCVYNGTGNTVNIFGLAASSTYRAVVLEYNGTAGTEAYNLSRYNTANVTTTAASANRMMASLNSIGIAPDNNGGPVVANNILSPNNDGKNDVWIVNNIEFHPNNTVSVTDAGGNVVFSKKGYTNDWAGTYRGAVLKEGTYYYTIDLGNASMLKGFFTVVRDR